MFKSFEADADGIEFDIQKCLDGYIVIHDITIIKCGRLCDIRDLTVKEISGIRSGLNAIPELKSFIKSIPNGKIVNAELKPDSITSADFKDLNKIFSKRKNDLIISSFDHSLLSDYSNSGYHTGALLDHEHFNKGFFNLLFSLKKINLHSVNIPIDFFYKIRGFKRAVMINLFRLVCRRIIVWTVNKQEDFELSSTWADIVITDDVLTGTSFRNTRK